MGIQRRQLLHALLQDRPIVQAGAGNDLSVHHDPRLGKFLHDLQALAAPPLVSKQLPPDLRVRGVDGDVDG